MVLSIKYFENNQGQLEFFLFNNVIKYEDFCISNMLKYFRSVEKRMAVLYSCPIKCFHECSSGENSQEKSSEVYIQLVSNGKGGVIITWEDSGNIYARILKP
jgi:hypothetical protein